MFSEDTIVAIATAIVPQQGSIGIVRLSGSLSLQIAQTIFVTRSNWQSHHVLYGHIVQPETGQTLDEALVLYMQAPRSYTKEDVIEFHCHGGIIPVQQVLQLCLELGARLAKAGEFTMRAFLNGRLDLAQAESVAELVGARSPLASKMALAGLEGKLSKSIESIRSVCLDILTEVEARIDFEDDLPPLDEQGIKDQIAQVLLKVKQILSTAEQGELLRQGLKVAIVGRPNVGKSSLLNAWSRSDRAIVTDLPGTTRDIVESQLVVNGIPIQVLDTAGIRESSDQVERLGIARSQQAAQRADLILFTIDAQVGWTNEDELIYQQIKEFPLILLINKIDIACQNYLESLPSVKKIVEMAAAKNQGIENLERAILDYIELDSLTASNLEIAINQRQSAALTTAQISLEQVQQTIENQLPLDFWSIDLRSAITALGEITGQEVSESLLERIFSRFCIGK
ncbi:MAG: tRNA uridine-5-carboxymethylaminomethyl(34) synthesis GTPase MnmE [Cyanobacteriota bacterium ELA615]